MAHLLKFLCILTENSSNIRRDITAETSLMNDLDKRINYELDSPRDARFNPQNVNLISLNSDENLQSNNQSWCFNGGSKTNSDNASLERYGTASHLCTLHHKFILSFFVIRQFLQCIFKNKHTYDIYLYIDPILFIIFLRNSKLDVIFLVFVALVYWTG